LAGQEGEGGRPAVSNGQFLDDQVCGLLEEKAVDRLHCSILVLRDQIFELARAATGMSKTLDERQGSVQSPAAVDNRWSRCLSRAARALDDDRLVGQSLDPFIEKMGSSAKIW
jgi:hypothetical protein